MSEKFYIARDKGNQLFLYKFEPEWFEGLGMFKSGSSFWMVDRKLLPKIKPGDCYEVELNLGKKIK